MKVSIRKTEMKNILETTFTPHLKGKELCKNFLQRANSRLLQLWKLRNLNINDESLIVV